VYLIEYAQKQATPTDFAYSIQYIFCIEFLAKRNVAVLHHPPYSPDLAPADYFLFPKLKFSLKGRHFQTVEEIQCAVRRELNNISKTAFLEGIKKLKKRAKNVFIKEESILKNRNKSCPNKKLSVFYNRCLESLISTSKCQVYK
jgi:hypothetical protein